MEYLVNYISEIYEINDLNDIFSIKDGIIYLKDIYIVSITPINEEFTNTHLLEILIILII